jgi:aryl-alcohol dehydrogenase-like predicted oxidoreductase
MEIRSFGRTGLKVSALCLGTMTFGNQADEAASCAIMDRAWDAGIFFFDTSDVYPVIPSPQTWGRSEEIIGAWLRQRGVRDQLVLATKARGRMGPGPNDEGLGRRHLLDAVHASLRRLGTDHIDLYQVHAFDDSTPLDETLRALDDMVRQGLVRYIGCSNFEAWRLCRSLWVSDVLRLARFDSVQPRYNLLDRRIETEMLPLCRDQQVAVIPYSPLAGGLLTGKYRRDAPHPATGRYIDFGRQSQLTEPMLDAVSQIATMARERGLTTAQFALGWVMAQPDITAPLIGATRVEQLDETLAVAPLRLTGEEQAACNAVWRGVSGEVE